MPIWPNGGAGITDGVTGSGTDKIKILPDYREGLAREFSPTNTKVLVGAIVTALDPATGAQIAAFPADTVLNSFSTSTNEAELILKTNLSTGSPTANTILSIPAGSILCFNENVVPGTSSPLTGTDQWSTSMEDSSTPMNPGSCLIYTTDAAHDLL